jgi:hypothetical protein
MPKYKSHVVTKPKIDPETGETKSDSGNRGRVVLEPLNDAAKLNKNHYAEAIVHKVYTPPKGETQAKIHNELIKRQYKSVGQQVPDGLLDR